MKKVVFLLIISLFVFSGVAGAQVGGDFVFRLGFDMSGEMDLSTDRTNVPDEHDVKSGYSLTGEYRLPYDSNLAWGAGISYQLERELEDAAQEGMKFSYTPIYLLGEYRMEENPIYVVGHLGYNLFSTNSTFEDEVDFDDTSGGLYYALGAGAEYEDRYVFEALYTVNNSTLEYDDEAGDIDLKYTKFTISLGVKF